jgi:hypothetical protein
MSSSWPKACASPAISCADDLLIEPVRSKLYLVSFCGAMCRPYGTRLINLYLPGTPVPGYRLFRASGTGSLQWLRSAFTQL